MEIKGKACFLSPVSLRVCVRMYTYMHGVCLSLILMLIEQDLKTSFLSSICMFLNVDLRHCVHLPVLCRLQIINK